MNTQQIQKNKITGLAEILGQSQKNKYLGFKDLYNLAESLSHSQGFYSRLFANLQELNEEERAGINYTIQAQRFTTDLDLILWLEQ